MAEQRLIDANNLGIGMAYQSEFYPNYFAIGWNSALKAVTEISPTIDPETLPIVRQLREELERVTAERDAAVSDLRGRAIESYSECMYCLYRTAKGFCWNCNNGSNWTWRGLHKEE